MTTPTPKLEDQSLLFLFINEIAKNYCPIDRKDIFDAAGNLNPLFPPKYVNNDIIKNCIPETDTQINRNKPSETALFYLKNAIYSVLVPDIRFFKVTYGLKDGFPDPDQRKLTECPFPRALRSSIVYDSKFKATSGTTIPPTEIYGNSEDVRNFAQPLVNRAGQIGIKSFNWNFVGSDSYTAQRDIEAELTLTMDGIGALSALRKNEAGQKYRLMDLLIQSDCFKEQTGGTQTANTSMPLKYDPGCYEIMVEAGYFIDKAKLEKIVKKMGITEYSPVNFDDADIERAIADFDVSKLLTTLYLTVVDHKFTFGDNGKVECTVNYRARSAITQRFSNLNVYYSAEQNRILEIFRKKIEALEAVLLEWNTNNPSGSPPGSGLGTAQGNFTGLSSEYFTSRVGTSKEVGTKEKTEQNLDRVKSLRDKFIRDDVQGSTTNFFGEVIGLLEKEKLVYRLDVSNMRTEIRDYKDDPTIPNLTSLRGKFIVPTAAQIAAYNKALVRAGAFTTRTVPAPDPLPGSIKSTTGSSGKENIFYFLGDLLDAVLFRTRGTVPGTPGIIRKNVYKNYRFILGNVKLADPTRSSTAGNSYTQIPLAAFPISHEVFRKMGEDLKSQKSPRISFIGFVNKLLKMIEKTFTIETTKVAFSDKKLLFKTLTFDHYADSTKGVIDQDITYTPYQALPAFADVDVVNMSPNKIAHNGLALTGRSSELLPVLPQTNLRLDASIANNFNLYHLVCFVEESAYNFAARQYGDIVEDFKNNIPHFSHGQGYGLIKKVTLEKSDIPFAKEQRFEQANKNNQLDGRADFYLTNFYNATFEMMGNDLCSLGGYIYFDPFGLAPNGSLGQPNQSSPPSLSYIMGLGGIHIITKISHKMTPGKYTTTVKTRWENRGVLKSS